MDQLRFHHSRLIAFMLALSAPALSAQGTSERLTVLGGEVVYDVAGPASAPPIVLLHGAFMDRRSWDREVAAYVKQYRVIRMDMRPFGESTLPQKPYSVPEDVVALMDYLKIGQAHVMGHSFGGSVAVDLALLHPDRVASLVLVSSSPSGFAAPPDEAKAAMAIFAAVKEGEDAIVKAWVAHPMWVVSRDRPEIRTEIEQTTRRNLAPFKMTAPPYIPLTPPAVGRLAEIKTPTLVVYGDRDTPGNRQGAELLATQIAGAKRVVIAGADHGVPLGWSRELNDAALTFLAAPRR
jgi:pimeloyl-ACP methyl ester carboxylesterase